MKKLVILILFLLPVTGVFSDYIELSEVLKNFKYTLEWDDLREYGLLNIAGRRITFKIGLSWVLVDYRERIDIEPIIFKDGAVLLSEKTISVLKKVISEKKISENYPHISVIMIDPGHGGKDPGTIGSVTLYGKKEKLKEKDIVLKIGLKIDKLLSGRYPDKKIVMTRTTDRYPTLEERVKMANKINLAKNAAMIFISIHANASINKKAKGFEIWYLPPNYRRNVLNRNTVIQEKREILPILNSMLEEEYTVESVTLARDIMNSLKKEVGKETQNRGLKAREWYVVRKARMP